MITVKTREGKSERERQRDRECETRERDRDRASSISAQFSLNRQVFWPIESESDPKSRSANIIYLRVHTA